MAQNREKEALICSFNPCEKPVKCAGLCSGHYEQHRRGQKLRSLRLRVVGGQICHCGTRAWARGLCRKHLDEQRVAEGTRYGTLEQRRARTLRFHYGMTPEEYDELFSAQNGVCAICQQLCRTGRHLAVDHDHETDEVRGLLCAPCNTAIGLMEDDPERLIAAVKYLTPGSGVRQEGKGNDERRTQ